MTVYHITRRETWEQAQAAGEYRGDTLDTDGFIHCSTIRQIAAVANSYYSGQHGLVLLCINTHKLQAELRYEAPAGPAIEGENLFPHIYGPLNVDAVTAMFDFEPGPDGSFTLPEGMIGLL
ncbi:MAG: DUF952 domain-containing protein [Anaerolineae bacterium]|nr:DUF952 domain-containing protein [Anaerolineae bacterium]